MNIDIYLKNKEEVANKFNEGELNSELGNYIFNKALINRLNKKQVLKINVKTDFEVNEKGKEKIVDMIRAYYGHLVKVELIYLKTNRIKSLILFVIGVVLLVFAQLIENVTKFLLPEIFIIMGWLAIWEMTYSLLFLNGQQRIKIKILKKLTTCYIGIEQQK